MKHPRDDIQNYQNLIYAVVATALRDTFRTPINGKLDREAESALNFLFGNDVDIWLELVDMDAEQYKKRLQDFMWSDDTQSRVSETEKRLFRNNYNLWQKKTNERELLAATYGTSRKWTG